MSVLICDALPGKGKTSACINLMNSDPKGKYIFVTQYLSEVDRIKQACSSRQFFSPEATFASGFKKIESVWSLIKAGKNITTTHALFESYTPEIKKAITDWGYTLILDEVIDVIANSRLGQSDIDILKRSESIKEDDNGFLTWELENYDPNGLFREEMLKAKSRNFLRFMDQYFFWAIPADLFTCFKNVYVLTYLFVGSPLRSFFEISHIDYSFIGVQEINGQYAFCDISCMNRKIDLKPLIHVMEDESLNKIGDKRSALSFSWYNREACKDGQPELEKLRRNLYNAMRLKLNVHDGLSMWTTYKQYAQQMRGKGFWNGFVTYNKRASNSYANRRYLAYLVNNYPRPWELRYYKEHGASMCPDIYALCILVQWIFRSAIRNGKEIWIYLPSRRMRRLLMMWLDRLAAGEDIQLAEELSKAAELEDEYEKKKEKNRIKSGYINTKQDRLKEFANSRRKEKRGGAKG